MPHSLLLDPKKILEIELSVIKPGLFQVLERFPQRKRALRQVYHKSESFRSICHSCQKCSEAIKYWTDSRLKEAPDRKREYEALLHELEREITQSLDEWN
jgi:hypothetical protein